MRSPADASSFTLAGANARLGAEVVRYAFLVEDLHPHSLPVSRRTQIKFELLQLNDSGSAWMKVGSTSNGPPIIEDARCALWVGLSRRIAIQSHFRSAISPWMIVAKV